MIDGHEAAASGYTCPECGGALWERGEGSDAQFECRIGDSYSAAQLWIENCAMRNQALKRAARLLAENAALARKLAHWAHQRSNHAASARLQGEAAEDDALFERIGQILQTLPPPDPEVVKEMDRR